MFCTKCGATVEPGFDFCTKCGAPVAQNADTTMQMQTSVGAQPTYVQAAPTPQPQTKSKTPIIVAIASVLIVLIAVGVAFAVMSTSDDADADKATTSIHATKDKKSEKEESADEDKDAKAETEAETEAKSDGATVVETREDAPATEDVPAEDASSTSSTSDDAVEATVETQEESSAGSTAVAEGEPFYGVWMSASKDQGNAQAFVDQLRSKGYDAKLYVSSEWSNLNPETWYVVAAASTATESEANAVCDQAHADGYADAYVKYSGEHL